MKAYINEDRCTACGDCTEICPDVFDYSDEDDSVVVISRKVPIYAEDDCEEAAEACPNRAIELD